MTHIEKLVLRNFRCFSSQTFSFKKPIILIEGENGVGKTALLEAIHYLCYLRSFRTHMPRELIHFDADGFSIQARLVSDDEIDDIHIGSTGKKRSVKINGKQVATFSEYDTPLKVISLVEGDLQLVQGSPDCRRAFIDQYIYLNNTSYGDLLRKYRITLEQRNALFRNAFDFTGYKIWSRNLWSLTQAIQNHRLNALKELKMAVNQLQTECGFSLPVDLTYKSKKALSNGFEEFLEKNPFLVEEERRYQRSLFGAHLDDFLITFKGKNSRLYASRGQQKLVVLLSKVAQIKNLRACGKNTLFLLDDFMTDFDEKKLEILIPFLLSLKTSIFMTCAQHKGPLYTKLQELDFQHIILKSNP